MKRTRRSPRTKVRRGLPTVVQILGDLDLRIGQFGAYTRAELGLIRLASPIGAIQVSIPYPRQPQNWIGRDRCDELTIRITPPIPRLLAFTLEMQGPGKSYRELVGAPEYLDNVDVVLDEFDASFNDLAAASLRYHLEISVCDNESRREVFEDLISRLTEPQPRFTPEESEILRSTIQNPQDFFSGASNRDPEEQAILDALRERRKQYGARIHQARHDFIDIVPELWS